MVSGLSGPAITGLCAGAAYRPRRWCKWPLQFELVLAFTASPPVGCLRMRSESPSGLSPMTCQGFLPKRGRNSHLCPPHGLSPRYLSFAIFALGSSPNCLTCAQSLPTPGACRPSHAPLSCAALSLLEAQFTPLFAHFRARRGPSMLRLWVPSLRGERDRMTGNAWRLAAR